MILKNVTRYQKMCVLTKYIIQKQVKYVAFDYETLEIFCIVGQIKNNREAFHILFKNVIINYGVPNYMVCDSLFSYNKKYCDDYLENFQIKKIDYNYDVKKSIRKVRQKLVSHNQVECQQNRYRKCEYKLFLFYPKAVIYINKNLTFQFQNIRYNVINKKFRNGKAIAYYNETCQIELVQQKNHISKVEVLKKVSSKKGLTKYEK